MGEHLAIALDTGHVSVNGDQCQTWFANGGATGDPSHWKPAQGPVPSLSSALLVSAGGINGNVAQILRYSYIRLASAFIIDPDVFDVSNLNRALGVGVTAVGSAKAATAAEWLRNVADSVTFAQKAYEDWKNSGVVTPDDAVMVVGVDQVRTRLNVGSDWPELLLNGATAGATISTGVHWRKRSGCVGCWYGLDDSDYRTTRTAMACGAGLASTVAQATPASSYPFVSVAAASSLVAGVIGVSVPGRELRLPSLGGTVRLMSLRNPEHGQVHHVETNERCLLLCGESYLQAVLGRAQ